MPPNNILVTGGSGYLGGTLLHRLKLAKLLTYDTLYALVRTDSQAQAVKQYGATPLNFDSYKAEAVKDAVLKYNINIVFVLHDAIKAEARVNFIRALSSLKEKNGTEVHLLHVSMKLSRAATMILMISRPAEPNQSPRMSTHPWTNHSLILIKMFMRSRRTQILEARSYLRYVLCSFWSFIANDPARENEQHCDRAQRVTRRPQLCCSSVHRLYVSFESWTSAGTALTFTSRRKGRRFRQHHLYTDTRHSERRESSKESLQSGRRSPCTQRLAHVCLYSL